MTFILRKGVKTFGLLCIGGLLCWEAPASDAYAYYKFINSDSDYSDDSQELMPLVDPMDSSSINSFLGMIEESCLPTQSEEYSNLDSTEGSFSNNQSEESSHQNSTEESSSTSESEESSDDMDTNVFFYKQRVDLLSKLTQDLINHQEDTEAYLMCHTDLRILIKKGDFLYKSLMRMKEIETESHDDSITSSEKATLNSDFWAQLQSISMILNMGEDKLSPTKNYYEMLAIPNGEMILIPTYRSIVEGVKGINITTIEDSAITMGLLDVLIPRTAETIGEISAKVDLVSKLLDMNSIYVDITKERVSRLMSLIGGSGDSMV